MDGAQWETGPGKSVRATLWKILNTRLRGLNFICRNRGPTQMNWGKERNMSGRPIGSEELQGEQELRWTEEEGKEKQRWI